MKKQILSLFVCISMVLTTMVPVLAAETVPMEKHSRFVTGVTFIWTYGKDENDDPIWKPAAPGDIYHIDMSETLGRGAQNIKLYAYDMKNFDPGKATEGSMNKTSYDDNYMPFAVTGMAIQVTSQPDVNGKITYSYQFDLKSINPPYNVAESLRKGKEQEIRDLLGYVAPDMEKFFADAREGKLNEGIQAQLYFMPYVIEWETPAITCSVCGLCKLAEGTKCSESTCDKWAQPGCGCYYPPFVEPEQPTAPPETNGCNSVIQWNETKSHTWHCGGCLMGGGCPGHNCNHSYSYQTALVAKATINPSALKSGYGFTVDVKNTINSGQISNRGGCGKSLTKQYSNVPKPPAAAEVWLGWKVKNRLGTQPTAVLLEKSGSTATTSTFQCKQNKISEKKERKIYTDVAVKGTGKKPVNHPVTVVISGGGVNGVPFCINLAKSITINGDMYEDDFTVDRKVR